MRKIYLAIFSCLAFTGLAQQDLQFTQFQFNRMYYNPGVVGSGGAICINGVHRSQWVGFEGAPTSQNINANVPLKILHGGLGLKISNDQIGYFQIINAGLGYAFQYNLGNGTIGAGFSANISTQTVNNAEWIAPDGSNGSTDPFIAPTGATGVGFDMDFGFYYESPTIWAGISSSRLLESATPYTSATNSITTFYNRRHYYLMGGYNYQWPSSNLELQPALLLKTDFAASSVVDVNLTALYNNKLWGGVSYRLTEAVAVNIGYQFTKALRAGYSYDIPITDISGQGGGSHEIFLSYCFKIEIPPKPPGSYKNPRFM